jgi:hypothetical protein
MKKARFVQEDFDLDIFVRMRGRKYADLQSLMDHHQMADGTRIPYLKAEGLIILKQGSLREKDRIDVAALMNLSRNHRPPPQTIEGVSLDSLRPEPGENESPDGGIRQSGHKIAPFAISPAAVEQPFPQLP